MGQTIHMLPTFVLQCFRTRRDLVRRPGDWLWSSYSFYTDGEPGLVTIDAVY